MTTLYFAAFLLAALFVLLRRNAFFYLATLNAAACWTILMPRKVHATPIRRWGGFLGIYLGILVGVLGLWLGFPHFRVLLNFRQSMYARGALTEIISPDM